MFLLKYIGSFLFPTREQLVETKPKSIKLLMIHNLNLSKQEVAELKKHLISEIQVFLGDSEKLPQISTTEERIAKLGA